MRLCMSWKTVFHPAEGFSSAVPGRNPCSPDAAGAEQLGRQGRGNGGERWKCSLFSTVLLPQVFSHFPFHPVKPLCFFEESQNPWAWKSPPRSLSSSFAQSPPCHPAQSATSRGGHSTPSLGSPFPWVTFLGRNSLPPQNDAEAFGVRRRGARAATICVANWGLSCPRDLSKKRSFLPGSHSYL